MASGPFTDDVLRCSSSSLSSQDFQIFSLRRVQVRIVMVNSGSVLLLVARLLKFNDISLDNSSFLMCVPAQPLTCPSLFLSYVKSVSGPWLTSVWGRSCGCCGRSSTPTRCSTRWRSSLLPASSYLKSKVSQSCRGAHEMRVERILFIQY